jgi:hypothetical protein
MQRGVVGFSLPYNCSKKLETYLVVSGSSCVEFPGNGITFNFPQDSLVVRVDVFVVVLRKVKHFFARFYVDCNRKEGLEVDLFERRQGGKGEGGTPKFFDLL